MEIEVKKLSSELLNDWLDYFDNAAFSDDDDWPGCYCMHFHWNERLDNRNDWNGTLEQVYRKTGKADNRGRAIRLIKKGIMQGYLAYYEGKVVGWCNANDKKNYNTVMNSFFDNKESNRKIKSIVCFCITSKLRRMGIATKLLEKVMEDACKEGYEYIEVYPYSHGQDNDFHGSLAMYEKMGFSKIGQNMDDCIIMRRNML
jgi:ribosomal protein S18 acetylase RimI-like enzyme